MYTAPFFIKDYRFKNNLFMAPLAGITDKPFRSFLRQFEPGFMFTEMIAVNALLYDRKLLDDYIQLPGEKVDTGVQIVGHYPEQFESIAAEIDRRGVRWLDINCGCSVPKVLKQKCGAYLLSEPELCRSIFRAVRKSFSGICSVKIRAGRDRTSLNYKTITGIAFEEGFDVVFFHPRTVKERFSVPAEWDWVKELKASFPDECIVGNGDLLSPADIEKKWRQSKADAVLLARGAMKAPWIFQQLQHDKSIEPGLEQRIDFLFEHLDHLIAIKGENKGVREMRKYIGWYLSGFPGVRELRSFLPFMKTRKDVVRFIQIGYNRILT